MKPRTVVFLTTFFVSLSFAAQAQRWKSYRFELQYGVGATNFLGELGGANQIGTNYFRDLELVETRPAFTIAYRYKLHPYFALKSALTYGTLAGDDKLTKEKYRNYRNLSFRSRILELAVNFEAAYMKEQLGHRYRLRGIKGQQAFEVYQYFFAGLGVFYFNPKAKLGDSWYALRPLSTEGQGIIATRRKYSPVQIAIPVGVGFKYSIGRQLGLQLEYGLRKTFTDYIDDASKTFVDSKLLKATKGDIAFRLADRSDHSEPAITWPGEQRGDVRDKDSYMFLMFSVTYKMRTGRNNLPKF